MAIQTTLPDPEYRISDTGSSGSGSYGPGFKEVKLSSLFNTAVDRSNSGKVITRSNSFHQWNIDITYNPMTKAEFRPISSFLMQKRGGLIPFFVDLPQYSTPEDAPWNAFLNSYNFSFTSTQTSGSTTITIRNSNYDSDPSSGSYGGVPKPGEIFTISDSNFSNAYKVYMITRVENYTSYEPTLGRPSANDIRLTITPGLEKAFTTSATFNFKNAKFRVMMPSDVFEYSLNTENLYSFSLKLEEVLA